MRNFLLILALLLLAACESRPAANDTETIANEVESIPAPEAPAAGPAGPIRADTIPAQFRGVYDTSADACSRPSENRLAVGPRELRFHESIGAVRSVSVESGDSVRVTADFQGEGESWSAVHTLTLGGSGERLIVARDASRSVRVRCAGEAPASARPAWQSAASGEGDALFLAIGEGPRIVALFCPASSGDLLVNVPAFRPIPSEERMSFGAGGTAVTLVADPRGDRGRGGVSGRGAIPAELSAILASAAGIAVNYGAQNSGPHPAPPPDLAAQFLAGCRD